MSETSKESELVLAVLLYAARCWSEGDRHALRRMNFGAREIAAISALQMDDVIRAQRLGAHCLDITLNRDSFWCLLSGLERLREREELQRELIAADAPYSMMSELFATGARDYSHWRRVFGLPINSGRPPEPDEATEHAIWRACEQRMAKRADENLCGKDYLEIARACDASVRTAWRALVAWRQEAVGSRADVIVSKIG